MLGSQLLDCWEGIGGVALTVEGVTEGRLCHIPLLFLFCACGSGCELSAPAVATMPATSATSVLCHGLYPSGS